MSYYYHFRPTLFIGKHSGGLYALLSLVDEATVSIDVRVFSFSCKSWDYFLVLTHPVEKYWF